MKERTVAFEQEMQEKCSFWQKEQEEFKLAIKEQDNLTKKLRVREEEEYVYKRNLTRAKEQDQYLLEKQSLEKELAEKSLALEEEFRGREENISAAEKELRELRKQVEDLQTEKQQAILDTEQHVAQKLTLKYEYEAKLAQTKVEGEIKVYKQIIANLEAKVDNLEMQIGQFNERANQANLQVQDIAIKAIDGASRQRYFQLEKSVEGTKTAT